MKFYLLVLLSFHAFAQKTPLPPEKAQEVVTMFTQMTTQETDGRQGLFSSRRSRQDEFPLVFEQRLEELLRDNSIGRHYSDEVVLKICSFLGIKILPNFAALPQREKTLYLNEIVDTYTKLPLKMILTLKKRNKGIDVVADNITTHPDLAYLVNTRPRGWSEGSTWASVPGAGATPTNPTVIAGNSLHRGHGCSDLILHEVGHAVDRYLLNKNYIMDFSTGDEFIHLNSITPFESIYGRSGALYPKQNIEENFAELFALYFKNSFTRKKIERHFPEVLSFFETAFRN